MSMKEKSSSIMGIGRHTAFQYGVMVAKAERERNFAKMRELLTEYVNQFGQDTKTKLEFRRGCLHSSIAPNLHELARKILEITKQIMEENDES
jgi:lipoprotein NlpI